MRTFLLRFTALVALVVWVGGFTFYSAIVIPILHEEFGTPMTGPVTARVTDALNAIGVVALFAWWVVCVHDGSTDRPALRRTRLGLLAGSTAVLLLLLVLHRVMDRHLESGGLAGFYRLHRAYLLASTIQWVLNLGLLAASLAVWSTRSRLAHKDLPADPPS